VVNPIASDRNVMRRSLLSSVLEVVERNARLRARIGLFELGPVYLNRRPGDLPDEPARLAIVLTGPRELPAWQGADTGPLDFYDMKGMLEALLDGLHLEGARYEPGEHPAFHPGKRARIRLGERPIGEFGELHPLVHAHYDLPDRPVLAAALDLETLIAAIPVAYPSEPVPAFPPVLEDLAVSVDEGLPAGRVEEVIRKAGGRMVTGIRLFDVYRSAAIGAGKKSLAYSLTYQDPERTLTDQEAADIRQRIVRRLEEELGAKLRA
jgi:phenylalanyl-tRNA synthetase beta chain